MFNVFASASGTTTSSGLLGSPFLLIIVMIAIKDKTILCIIISLFYHS